MKTIFFVVVASCILGRCGKNPNDPPGQNPVPIPGPGPAPHPTSEIEACVWSKVADEPATATQNIVLGINIKRSCAASDQEILTILGENK